MKTKSLPFQKMMLNLLVLVLLTASSQNSQAQELVFHNATWDPTSPAAGTVGAIYRFPLVNANMDALVKISDRSSGQVKLDNIDESSIGFDKAFQPVITYGTGTSTGSKTWWMEFTITFVNKNTSTAATISSFKSTALDIDGNNSTLREWDAFYYPTAYTLENPTQLSVSSLLQTILGLLTNVGKTFEGTLTDHSGIDTSATALMTTVKYTNTSSFVMRFGATTTGAVSNTTRNFSTYFKDFTYNAPVTLPIKLASFTAMLNGDKADLKWVTSSEINVSHFIVEKSFNGKDFSDAGMVFAYGSASSKTNYNFSDNVNMSQNGVVYYRLRSVDIDGKNQYSETRILRISNSSSNMITILTYPNPATSELRITIPTNWQNKKVVYELFTNNGQVAKRIEASNSSQTETLNVNGLSAGFYLVRVSCDGEIAQQKIIKQ